MKFIITGFGPFGSFTVNPASQVAEAVAQNLRKQKIEIEFVQILTSIQDVLQFYDTIKENVFVIHIGLYDGSEKPQIETLGHNLADFSIPDVRGNQPRRQKIIKSMELRQAIPQCFDFKTILDPGLDLNYSTDAGNYICNYCFVQGLQNVGKKISGTTFIHIPSLQDYSLEKSMSVISQVILAINAHENTFKQ